MSTKLYILFLLFFILVSEGFAASTNLLRDMVIRTDTTWTGLIVIEGVIVVGRGATLTIKPGTQISFKKIDRNLDGIGDAEIRVLGRILAQGTNTAPILFHSAEAKPAPLDWSYLLIFTSGDHNIIEFCRFEDGFSGLQVQFSTATVSDSWFRNNNDGIRFGRAKLSITHNSFTHNSIGIRFTRMEGPADIKNNVISNNKVGIFLVPSGQNIRDFFKPGRGGTAWNKGHLHISHNSVFNNRQYNLKLGAKQQWDLNIDNNWWGSEDTEVIQNGIFDKNDDDELGTAIIHPISQKAPLGVGPK